MDAGQDLWGEKMGRRLERHTCPSPPPPHHCQQLALAPQCIGAAPLGGRVHRKALNQKVEWLLRGRGTLLGRQQWRGVLGALRKGDEGRQSAGGEEGKGRGGAVVSECCALVQGHATL